MRRQSEWGRVRLVLVAGVALIGAAVAPEARAGLLGPPPVWSWGDNTRGQLGRNPCNPLDLNPTCTDSYTPGMVGYHVALPGLAYLVGIPAAAIAAGGEHSLALQANGAILAWGANFAGQLGTAPIGAPDSPQPAAVVLPAIATAIAAGGEHSLALAGGTVLGWGANNYAQAGTGSSTPTVVFLPSAVTGLPLTPTASVAAGYHHSMVMLTDGKVWAWGRNNYGQVGTGSYSTRVLTPTAVSLPATATVTAIDGGVDHTVALMSDGTVWTWGRNDYGQLGNGDLSITRTATPAHVSLLTGTATAIAAGYHHSMAVLSDGTVWTWGSNQYGELGRGTITATVTAATNATPAKANLAGSLTPTAVSGGAFFSMARFSNGTLQSWGRNDTGQLGRATSSSPSVTPTAAATGTSWSDVSAGGAHTLARGGGL